MLPKAVAITRRQARAWERRLSPASALGAGLEHGATHRAETRRRAHLRVKEGYLGDGDVAARGEVGELRPALELPLGG